MSKPREFLNGVGRIAIYKLPGDLTAVLVLTKFFEMFMRIATCRNIGSQIAVRLYIIVNPEIFRSRIFPNLHPKFRRSKR